MGQSNSDQSKLRLFYFVILGYSLFIVDCNESEAFCTNPAGDRGKCIDFRDCKPLPRAWIADIKFLKNSQCDPNKGPAYICCPDKRHVLPEPPHCGVRTTTRLMGIQLTQPDDYSWTALIEYEKPRGSTDVHCGGTLINQGHILTAAHCVHSLPAGWKVHRILLGEWDLSSVLDCAFDYCNDPPISLQALKIIVHEAFDGQNGNNNHDIALVRFEELKSFPDTILPICLPLTESIRWENMSDGTIVGWGKALTSVGLAKKLMVNLKIRNYHECSLLLKSRSNVEPSKLCVSKDERSSRKICSVDVRGGLMWVFGRFHYLIGIAGSVEHRCGTVDVPSVLTNGIHRLDTRKYQIACNQILRRQLDTIPCLL